MGQNLVFRRGLFHITIKTGADSDVQAILRLAQVIDHKIRDRARPSLIPRSHGAKEHPLPLGPAVELWTTSLDLKERLSSGSLAGLAGNALPEIIMVEPGEELPNHARVRGVAGALLVLQSVAMAPSDRAMCPVLLVPWGIG